MIRRRMAVGAVLVALGVVACADMMRPSDVIAAGAERYCGAATAGTVASDARETLRREVERKLAPKGIAIEVDCPEPVREYHFREVR